MQLARKESTELVPGIDTQSGLVMTGQEIELIEQNGEVEVCKEGLRAGFLDADVDDGDEGACRKHNIQRQVTGRRAPEMQQMFIAGTG